VLLVVIAVVLNAIFIPIYGIMVSFATLLSITIYSLAKLLFVVKRLHLYPFTKQTVFSVVTFILFIAFILEFPFTPIISIGFQINFGYTFICLHQLQICNLSINQVLDVVLKIEAQTIIF
jgi:O-antigen/teichoic acid export membrane protein